MGRCTVLLKIKTAVSKVFKILQLWIQPILQNASVSQTVNVDALSVTIDKEVWTEDAIPRYAEPRFFGGEVRVRLDII